MLLHEISRRVGGGVENMRNREANALSAGLALGMVVLGKGDESEWLGDLHLPDELTRLLGTTKVKPARPHRMPVLFIDCLACSYWCMT